jgi:hypothetical protein
MRESRVEREMTMKSIAGERVSGTKYAIMPPPKELEEMRARGMTQRQIAEEVERRTGHRVTRNAVTMALKRAGLSGNVRRYEDLVPWRVRDAHSRDYALTMLRAEARRRRGIEMSEDLAQRLGSWKAKLTERDVVVVYEPDTEEGFWYRPRRPGDDDLIRKPE